jgi:hypothetical protein
VGKTNNFFLQQHPVSMRSAEKGSYREALFRVLELPLCTYESFHRMMVPCLDNREILCCLHSLDLQAPKAMSDFIFI